MLIRNTESHEGCAATASAAAAAPSATTAEAIVATRLMAIVRTPDPDVARAAVRGLVEGGVAVAELALSHPAALDGLARCAQVHGDELLLGAGTILTVAQAEAALAAGARFLVSPGFDPALHAFARERGVLHLPGVLTPSEVGAALAAGASLLKLFPAGRLGPGHLADLLAPFPAARFVATGGVDASNARAFLAAGAVAVAPGGALLAGAGDPAAGDPGDPDAIAAAVAARAAELHRLIQLEPVKEPRAD
jgi:2-dehydro-3-deoxyphosphogluconate aldolase/(4S)-4-hydroxy-2-oxoglutarate aldolase